MNIRAYVPFANAGMQSMLAYKWNFLGFSIGEIFFTFVMYFLWKAVFLATPDGVINGFSMLDMTAYIFVANITGYLAGTDALYSVGEEIIDGSIAMRLTKPISYNLSFMAGEIGSKIIIFCIILVPVFFGVEVFRWTRTGLILFSPAYFFLYLLSAGLSFVIQFYFDLCFGYICFILKNIWGLNLLKEGIVNLLSGSLIPIVFFPGWIRTVLEVMPFASMRFTPVMIYIAKYSGPQIAAAILVQIAWACLLWLLSKCIWRISINHLTIQGG
ncbi:ABC-2 family transporter protein [Brucepastera parasyntrophica]|uniref:ABC transporter permease n=1 Tax=Brucepastera parasyntrophica TaxID=2880008 RepID=UPI0021091593|nr:ABC-2 family transporter protein [Brucepastera parasyntrophica]ULQ59588.1 ABC-2 family transporter protein [Brucepastera parasyntrophica]